MKRDLGTYYVRVELPDNQGFIYQWDTCARYTHGRTNTHPLTAARIEAAWENEAELLASILFMFTEGNFSCDCNLRLFLDDAAQVAREADYEPPCGDLLHPIRLTVVRPDGSEVQIYPPSPAARIV